MFGRIPCVRALVIASSLATVAAASPAKIGTAAKPASDEKPKAAKAASEEKPKASKPAHPTEEPEYVSIPHRVNPKDKSLQPLERQTYGVRSKAKGLGFGGSRASYEIPGATSTTRFTAGEPMTFVIRLASKDVDPSSVFKLVPLQSGSAGKKQAKAGVAGVRQAVWMDQKGLFGSVNVDPMMGALAILAKPYGSSSVEFRPEADLAPGEYAILLPNTMTAYCFGVDAK